MNIVDIIIYNLFLISVGMQFAKGQRLLASVKNLVMGIQL